MTISARTNVADEIRSSTAIDPDAPAGRIQGEQAEVLTTTRSMPIHEICSIFPLMSDEEFAALKTDIAANGQREPIRTYQGKVIDGRNRLQACLELGVEPIIAEWNGNGSLVSFVVSLNLHRRHLSTSQRIACGVDIEESFAKEAKERQRVGSSAGGKRSGEVRSGKVESNCSEPSQQQTPQPQSRDKAGAIVGVHPVSISRGKVIKKRDPKLHEEVKAGKKTVHQANREVQRAEKRAQLEAKAAAVATSDSLTCEVIEGDCVAVLATVEPGTVRLAFLDPPYNEKVDYGAHYDDNLPPERYLARCRVWFEAASRVLSEDGTIMVLTSSRWGGRTQCLLEDLGLVTAAEKT